MGEEKIRTLKNERQKEYDKRTAYSAQKKYIAESTKKMTITFVKTTDKDILDKLESVPNKAGYIKALIRADIAAEKK